jgi:acetylornithine deacetylase
MTPQSTGERLDEFLTECRSELIELACDLIAINSQSPPNGDERAISNFLQDKTAAFGLGRATIVARDPARPNLVITAPGTGAGPNLVLNAHVDTKPVGDARAEWRTDPLGPVQLDGKLYGLGSSDMKSAVAAMVFAARALRETGVQLGGDLILAFVADEESGAAYGSQFLAPKLAGIADACLIGEPSGWTHDWQGIHVVSRGISCFKIRVHGTQMHSSLSDRMPSVSAVGKMAELIVRMRDEVELQWKPHALSSAGPTLNVGVTAEGGVSYGVVPGSASFGCDLRTLPGMTFDDVRDALARWVQALQDTDSSFKVSLEFEPNRAWIAAAEIDANHDLVEAVKGAAADVLGSSPELSIFPGATDAPWFEAAGIPTLASFGPGILTHCHGPNEYVSLESILAAARIYARTVANYCRAQ